MSTYEFVRRCFYGTLTVLGTCWLIQCVIVAGGGVR